MARPLRVDSPGGVFHAVNRGIARRSFFENAKDAERFLRLLEEQSKAGRLKIQAWSFLHTHFHILAASPIGELSEAMQAVGSEYVQGFNRTRDRDGPLFKGRFHSVPVRSLAHHIAVVKYIDQNAVLAGLATRPEEYAYGSARYYVQESGPDWMDRSWVESQVMGRMGLAKYDPRAYRIVFGTFLTQGQRLYVERCYERGRDDAVDLDEVLVLEPPALREWMAKRAEMADGTRARPLLVDADSVTGVLGEQMVAGEWSVPLKLGLHRDLWQLARCTLLYDLAAATATEISIREGISRTQVSLLIAEHKYRLREDPAYAARLASLAHAVLRRCHPDGPHLATGV